MDDRVKPIFFALILVFYCVSARTQINTHYYHSEHFGIEEGLHHGVIMDMYVDQKGFVWIHTFGQLQLFDGRSFINVHHQFPESGFIGRFNTLVGDHMYFLTSGALYRFTPSQYDRQTPAKLLLPKGGKPDLNPIILYEDDHALFIGHTNDSIYQVRKPDMTILKRFVLPQPFLRTEVNIKTSPEVSSPDILEFIGKDYNLYSFHLPTASFDTLYALNTPRSCIKIGVDTFVSLNNDALFIHTPEKEYTILLPDTTQEFFGEYLLEFTRNQVLVALGYSIYVFNLDTRSWVSRFQKTAEGHFYDVKLRSMKRDATGNIYFTSFTSGLTKLYPRNDAFQYVGTRDPDKRFVLKISGSDRYNLVIMATLQDGLLIYDTTGNFLQHVIDFPGGGRHRYITGLVKFSENRFVILTDRWAYELTVDHKQSIYIRLITSIDPEWINYYSTTIQGYAQDKHFVTGWYGLNTVEAEKEILFKHSAGHPFGARIAVTPFRSGYLASGMDTMIWMDDAMDKVIGQYVLPKLGFHRCLLAEDDQHVLLGTDSGLYRIRIGENAQIRDTLYARMVYSILPGDRPGQYWFGSDYGLFHLDTNDLLTNYSIESGLQDNEFNTNATYRSENGKLYFGGVNGITTFYPSQVRIESDNLENFVSSLSVNHEVIARYISTPNSQPWVFSHSQSNIGIELLGKGRRSPSSYNYQYMIPQLHPGWVNMGRDARIQFQLSPGPYTMYYHIGNAFDPNVRPDKFIQWVIRVPFYKSWWFLGLSGLILTSLLVYLIRLNRKRGELKLRYEFQLGQRLQNERMRISRELHDNIGAQMATVKRSLNFLISNNHLLSQEQSLQKMKDLEGISTQINQELRDTIWAAQNEDISVGDFMARIKNYNFQMLGQDSSVRVQYEEHCDKEVVLGPFIALNLHRICQEAVNNILKHAGATEIRMGFEGDHGRFNVSIADNGKGFDPDTVQEGYGLQNIRHRSAQIGAKVSFYVVPSGGNALVIEIEKLILSNKTLG